MAGIRWLDSPLTIRWYPQRAPRNWGSFFFASSLGGFTGGPWATSPREQPELPETVAPGPPGILCSRICAMSFPNEKLYGLDRERVLAAVEPVLAAHQVEGVELLWKTDRGSRVLEVNVERPGTSVPGAGITTEVCAEISRDLSTALDVAEAIPCAYRLVVGSPGLDRALYRAEDYARFAGQTVKVKLREPVGGQHVLKGILQGLGEDASVLVQVEGGPVSLPLAAIETARLVFEWKKPAGPRARHSPKQGKAHKRERDGVPPRTEEK